MSIRKILILCSALDLDLKLGTTPAWWQLMKGLHEMDCEVIVAPYRGRSIRTLWWRCYSNPCRLEGELYGRLNNAFRHLPFFRRFAVSKRESFVPKLARVIVRPKWKRQLKRILTREKDIDALMFLQVPLNHLKGLPTYMKEKFGIPVVCYDGDMPVSLPAYGGYTFNYYIGADLTEFDAFIVNSEGVVNELKKLGANKVFVVHYGVDPDIYLPFPLAKDVDIFYSGFGHRFRERWIEAMIKVPSLKLNALFLVAGPWFDMDLGRAVKMSMIPFSSWIRYCCRSKIALNIIRDSHSMVYRTSSSRPFELAALGCCVVSNPYSGLEKWFKIGKEMVVVKGADEAVEVYQWLLSDEETRIKMGEAARERVLKEHTFKHRARQLLNILDRFS